MPSAKPAKLGHGFACRESPLKRTQFLLLSGARIKIVYHQNQRQSFSQWMARTIRPTKGAVDCCTSVITNSTHTRDSILRPVTQISPTRILSFKRATRGQQGKFADPAHRASSQAQLVMQGHRPRLQRPREGHCLSSHTPKELAERDCVLHRPPRHVSNRYGARPECQSQDRKDSMHRRHMPNKPKILKECLYEE
ncbi:hypothetical protein PVK06_017759 [Gossypium arboreum]|uniref:Uncharacterized protein n=1 Tax=Gossypium arboreum TaxID=29729 RepID=A0ABR0Q3K8_GOSAR|nr:hypothetical protein PVK06_017759 [Gossypium arboreum]